MSFSPLLALFTDNHRVAKEVLTPVLRDYVCYFRGLVKDTHNTLFFLVFPRVFPKSYPVGPPCIINLPVLLKVGVGGERRYHAAGAPLPAHLARFLGSGGDSIKILSLIFGLNNGLSLILRLFPEESE